MASFDDVNRVMNTPWGNTSEVEPFVQKPDIPFIPSVPGERQLSFREIYLTELGSAERKAGGAAIDLWLAGTFVAASPFLETLQSEQQALSGEPSPLSSSDSLYVKLFDILANAPADWKAVALAAGAFALVSASNRARRPYAVERDITRTIQRAQLSGAEITPHTESTYRRFRRIRRAGQFIGTAAATGVAYGIGRHLSLEADLVGGAIATSAGALRATSARNKFLRRAFSS